MAGKGKGFGKTILFGEHFVVYGLPAIASAISDYTLAEVSKGKKSGWELIDGRPAVEGYKQVKQEEISKGINAVFEFLKIDLQKNPVRIRLSGNLLCASGMGASAALATSIARALNQHFSLQLNDEQINEISYVAEKAAASASGIDNTCATFGGMLSFRKNLEGGKNKIELIRPKQALHVVLVNTGISQETSKVVAEVKDEKEKNPAEFEKIFEEYLNVYGKGLESLKKGDLREIGAQMDENQGLLRRINVSCPEIEQIILLAKNNGALGAKLTGTGRGGIVVCLAPNKKLQEKMAKKISELGFKTTKTELGKIADKKSKTAGGTK